LQSHRSHHSSRRVVDHLVAGLARTRRIKMVETKPDTLMAYCGLDCSTCFGYTKTISESAKGLRRTMRTEKIKQVWPTIPFLGDYDSFKKSLDALAGLRCGGCRQGGGNPFCKIRKCAQKRGYETCAECAEFESCEKLPFLEPGHKDEHLRNLRRLKKAKASGSIVFRG